MQRGEEGITQKAGSRGSRWIKCSLCRSTPLELTQDRPWGCSATSGVHTTEALDMSSDLGSKRSRSHSVSKRFLSPYFILGAVCAQIIKSCLRKHLACPWWKTNMAQGKTGMQQKYISAEKGLELTGTHPPIPAEGFSLEQLSICCPSPDHLE